MKNPIASLFFSIFAIILSSALLVSCQAIGDIFGAGVYTGIFLVVIVVVIIIVIVARLGKK